MSEGLADQSSSLVPKYKKNISRKIPGINKASFQENGIEIENIGNDDNFFRLDDRCKLSVTPHSRKKYMNPLLAVVSCFPVPNDNSEAYHSTQTDRHSRNLLIPYERIIFASLIDKPKIQENVGVDGDSINVSSLHNGISGTDFLFGKDDDSLIQVTYLVDSGNDLVPRKVNVRIEKKPNFGNIDILGANISNKEMQNDKISDENLKILQTRSNIHYMNKKYLIFINPNGGKGKALYIFNQHIKSILDAANVDYTVIKTEYYKHCVDIVSKMEDLINYDVIACCSGDGIPHEVINGIYSRVKDRVDLLNKIAITQLPCGSGNAFLLSCHKTIVPSRAALSMLKSSTIKMDLMALTQADENSFSNDAFKTTLSFLSQTYGLIADADIGTEWMRYLGPSRFEFGVAYKVLSNAKYSCKLQVKYRHKTLDDVINSFEEYHKENKSEEEASKHEITEEDLKLKMPSMNENLLELPDWKVVQNTEHLQVFYTGKMPYIAKDVQFFPAALPNDGCMDMVIMDSSNTGFLETAKILTSLSSGTQMFLDGYKYSKIEGYRFTPVRDNFISVDGENFPIKPMQGEVLHKILKTMSKDAVFEKTILSK